jgi:hypothetical protein
MLNPTAKKIRHCVERLQAGYRNTYGNFKPEYASLIGQATAKVLSVLAYSDAPYHNVDHTILVTLVGQEILTGKQIKKGNVDCEDWLHFIISLLCHDVGFVRGICRQDKSHKHYYATGMGDRMVAIAPKSTDAGLNSYHVDRSKLFVQESFTNNPLIDVEVIQHNIELTRFPIPNDELHKDTVSYAGLTRAADLIGQLSDPLYLEKIPALFKEMQETGANRNFGYRHPKDIRAAYPKFYTNVICPYIQEGVRYLQVTQPGRDILTSLYANVSRAERETKESQANFSISQIRDFTNRAKPTQVQAFTA